MAIDQSTFDDAVSAYVANADYAEAGSLAKARAFQTAATQLLVLLPRAAAMGGGMSSEFDHQSVRAALADAKGYIAANDTSSSRAVFLDARNYRT
jgi:hypothetical protein